MGNRIAATTNLNRVRLYSLLIAFPAMALINYFVLSFFIPITTQGAFFMPVYYNRTPVLIVFYSLLLATTLRQPKKIIYDLEVIGLSKPWAAAFFTLRSNLLPFSIFFAWLFLLQLPTPLGEFWFMTILLSGGISLLYFMLDLFTVLLLLMALGAFTFGLLTIHLSTKST